MGTASAGSTAASTSAEACRELQGTHARAGPRPRQSMSFVYLDTSVALAHLLAEDRIPPDSLWKESLISSRLLEYEIWNRIHARKLGRSHGDSVQELTGRIALVELVAPVLERAKEAFPAPVRTLDALHLASITFLIDSGQTVALATYDAKMIKAARSISIEIYELR